MAAKTTRQPASRPLSPRPMSPRPMSPTMRPLSPSPTSTPTHSSHTSSNSKAPAHPMQMQLQNPIDGPLVRAKDEWKNPQSWFGVEDCGRLLDIPETFGGSQTLFKWPSFFIIVGTVAYLWGTQHDSSDAWFLGHLDHWALFISLLYMGMSLANAHFPPPQLAVADQGLNGYLKFFWIMFELAAHLELLTFIIFWTVGYRREGGEIDYGAIMLHGGVLILVWVDGMVMNHIPVRIKHYFFLLAVDTVYVVWTILHAVAGLDNGKEAPKITEEDAGKEIPSTSDAIYISLDWKDETVKTVFLAIGILTFIAPLCFVFQYLMSLYSFPWKWDGSKSRRTVDMHFNTVHQPQHQSPSPPDGPKDNHHHHRRTPSNTNGNQMGDSTRLSQTTVPMGDSSGDRGEPEKPARKGKRTKPRVISVKEPPITTTTPAKGKGGGKRIPPGSASVMSGLSNDPPPPPTKPKKKKETKKASTTSKKSKPKASSKRSGTRGPKNKNLNRQLSRDSLSIMDIA